MSSKRIRVMYTTHYFWHRRHALPLIWATVKLLVQGHSSAKLKG